MAGTARGTDRFGIMAVLASTAILTSACTGAASPSPSSTGAPASASAPAPSSSGPAASISGVDIAKQRIADYTTKPTGIPITEQLAQRPTGKTFVFVQCGVPECAAHARNLQEAAPILGVTIKIIPAGNTAASTQGAFASAAQLKPAAVLEAAIPAALWPNQLKELQDQGTPVVAWAIPEDAGNGLSVVFNGTPRFEATGKRMADYVIAQSNGNAHVVFFFPPEYAVFVSEANGFKQEVGELCPTCTVEIVEAPANTIGSTMPGRIVSYIQQKPSTNYVALAFGSMNIGVPQAMAAAGLADKVSTISQAGGQVNFGFLKDKQQTADLANDLHVEAWMGLDIAARLATGQQVAQSEGSPSSSTPQVFVTQDNVASQTVDSDGWWIAFPDYVDTFKKLWGVQ